MSFKIGDLVEILQSEHVKPRYRRYLGQQATVISDLVSHPDGQYYRIQLQTGELFYAAPRILKRIPPRQDWETLCHLNFKRHEVSA